MNVLEAALQYARHGFPVYAVDGKIPFRGSNGSKDATTDPDTIAGWWREHEDANVVIVAGPRSGLLVLDVDMHHSDGRSTLTGLVKAHGLLPVTPISETGGGGLHILFRWPEKPVKMGWIAEGLEFINWFVAPPSLHASGVRYQWCRDLGTPLADCPEWLLEMARKPTVSAARTGEELRLVRGERDRRLYLEGCVLRGRGWPESAIADALCALNRDCCEPPLDERTVREKARSACQHKPNEHTDRLKERDERAAGL